MKEITKESLRVFTIANPPIGTIPIQYLSNDEVCYSLQMVEILLLGCGKRISHGLSNEVQEFLKLNGIVIEYLDSVSICTVPSFMYIDQHSISNRSMHVLHLIFLMRKIVK
jgi:hypothetical protein